MLCEGKGSLGEGFFDYSAGVPRDGVEKTSFGMKNCAKVENGTKITKSEPNGSQREPKVSQKGAKREPKWSPKGSRRSPKGAQREPPGTKS